ncbi:MAG TPA: GTP-binding protein, partial [Kiloniellaceae bacterium]|nr:GTP-binding protein [Kiloniellaceae bacterium]
ATVDAVSGADTLAKHRESVKQAAVADRIVVTKADLVSDRQLAALEAELRAVNPAAPILPAVMGAIEPDRLFDAGLYDPKTKSLDVQRWLKAEAYDQEDPDHRHHDHGHSHDPNRHSAEIRAFCLTYDRPLDWSRFSAWVDMLIALYGSGLLRIKGLLNVEGMAAPVVIHGVQHVFHPPAQLPAWPDEDRRSKIVFITHGLDEAAFSDSLKAFNEDSPSPLS